MAAPSNTVWGSVGGDYARLGISVTTTTDNATQKAFKVEIWVWTKYSLHDSANTLYYTLSSSPSSAQDSKGAANIYTTIDSGGWSTTNQVKVWEYTHAAITKTATAQTRYLYGKITDLYKAGTISVSTTVSIPALASYTVSYNANGGSGAPASQTKTYGKTLKLSTATPTRTGYTFQGWATSASGSVAYASGANYTSNAAVTLYAVWKANTYTVTYNANGGTGAPVSQTKTYGQTLKLSSTIPTRTNYNFLGWGVAASSTTVAYASGANYTSNAAVTLYAVWQLAYNKPRITNFSVSRCNSSGVVSDDGTSALYTFDWECDLPVSSITLQGKLSTDTYWVGGAIPATGTQGSVNYVSNLYVLDLDKTYDMRVIVADANGSSIATFTLFSMTFPIDALPKNRGVAFGKVAELTDTVESAWAIKANKGFINIFLTPGTDLNNIKDANVYYGNNVATSAYSCGGASLPFTSGSFTLEVRSCGPDGQLQQIITVCSKTNPLRYERFYYTSAWGDWLPVVTFKKLSDIFDNYYNLEVTSTTKGTNWGSAEATAILIGNNLRCSITAERNSATAAGNVANETVCTFRVNHNGKIAGAWNVSFVNGTTGALAAYSTTTTVTDTEIEITVILSAVGTALTQTTAFFTLPVRLNIEAY